MALGTRACRAETRLGAPFVCQPALPGPLLPSLSSLDTYTGSPYTRIVKVRVFATSRYEREVRRLLTELEQAALQRAIAAEPEAHPIVPGTGGVRKARCGSEGSEKVRGGFERCQEASG